MTSREARHGFTRAAGSARETLAYLELPHGCCAVVPPTALGAQLNQIIGPLVKLVAA